jgi:hypothetical protein
MEVLHHASPGDQGGDEKTAEDGTDACAYDAAGDECIQLFHGRSPFVKMAKK